MKVKKSKASQVLWSITLGALLIGSIQGIAKIYSVVKKVTGSESYQITKSPHTGGDTAGFKDTTFAGRPGKGGDTAGFKDTSSNVIS